MAALARARNGGDRMPITANDNGVLHTLGTVTANDNGALRNKSTISVNDGGVIRSVFSANKVKIEGITPLVVADDHIVIVNSGSGTISLPAGAKIILGSGGVGQYGGFVAEYTLTAALTNASFTATVDTAKTRTKNATNIVIDGVTYGCGNVERIIQSKWGPIGGRGGDGAKPNEISNNSSYHQGHNAKPGKGAGGGGGGGSMGSYNDEFPLEGDEYPSNDPGRGGGNLNGYGNKGGSGGAIGKAGEKGSSGYGGTYYISYRSGDEYSRKHIYESRHCGCGGGGGYAAGGGIGGFRDGNNDEFYKGEDGQPGAGIIVIEL